MGGEEDDINNLKLRYMHYSSVMADTREWCLLFVVLSLWMWICFIQRWDLILFGMHVECMLGKTFVAAFQF